MICTNCQHDDGLGGKPLEGLPTKQVLHLCKEWLCAGCLKTDEEIQADFDEASKKENHQSAHDWARRTTP